jgi:hypothetical protein
LYLGSRPTNHANFNQTFLISFTPAHVFRGFQRIKNFVSAGTPKTSTREARAPQILLLTLSQKAMA